MNPKGMILAELLIATLLFSIAGSGLYTCFTEGLRAQNKIQSDFTFYDPFRISFLKIEGDLRNAVSLKNYPFLGKKDEISFPARLGTRLVWIRYFTQNHRFIRSEGPLTSHLKKGKAQARVLIRDLQSLEFQFPYKDEKENHFYESFWVEEPYLGIPRGVKINLGFEQDSASKIVSIPQGKFGRLIGENRRKGEGESLE